MTRESWRLSRRDVLRGGGLSLALPLLQGMNSVARASCVARPKRMVVTYFSYGAFMPGSRDGQPIAGQEHDAWNWWPCAEPGELTFNESSGAIRRAQGFRQLSARLGSRGRLWFGRTQ
ncbi:MAG: hypothetical protein R3B96_06635 [Pirellulaceae bacterium]